MMTNTEILDYVLSGELYCSEECEVEYEGEHGLFVYTKYEGISISDDDFKSMLDIDNNSYSDVMEHYWSHIIGVQD